MSMFEMEQTVRLLKQQAEITNARLATVNRKLDLMLAHLGLPQAEPEPKLHLRAEADPDTPDNEAPAPFQPEQG
jgi:hypothetical protein